MSVFDKPYRAHKDKLNPSTLLRTLWDICRKRGFASYEAAAVTINSQSNLAWSSHRLSFTKHVLRDVLRQKTVLKYWHLEAISRQVGVPTGILLIFSRMRSNRDKGLIGENARILRGLKEFAVRTLPDDPFEIETLFAWADVLGEQEGDQLALDLGDRSV